MLLKWVLRVHIHIFGMTLDSEKDIDKLQGTGIHRNVLQMRLCAETVGKSLVNRLEMTVDKRHTHYPDHFST
jgi:hypothetical protein